MNKIVLTPDAQVKNYWNTTVNGRDFTVSKSSFGWHVAERTGGKYVQHVFGLVFATKTQALAALAEGAK